MKLPNLRLILSLLLVGFTVGAKSRQTDHENLYTRSTLSLGVVVFPGFEPLDVFGPLEIFYSLSYSYKMTLSIIAHEVGPITSGLPPFRMTPDQPMSDFGYMLRPSVQATHSFADAPALDILLIPGGMGNIALEQENDTTIEDFVARRFDQVDYLLSVCTGAMSLARAGILSGKRATTNKGSWDYVTKFGENITWVGTARWVEDGKIWTSSGVAAGMDMTYAFLRHIYGEHDENLTDVMNGIEYAPHTNPDWDPFAVVHKVPGSDPDANLEGCVKPVGY